MTITSTACDHVNKQVRGTYQGYFDIKEAETYVKSTYSHIKSMYLVYFLGETDVQDGYFIFNIDF